MKRYNKFCVIYSLSFTMVILVSLLSIDISSAADVVFDNGTTLQGGGYISDYDAVQTGETIVYYKAGDSFSLSESATIEQIRWWGWNMGENPTRENDFTIKIYKLVNDVADPVVVLRLQIHSLYRTERGDYLGEYEYLAEINPISIDSSNDYLLVIINQSGTPNDLTDAWVWERSIDGDDRLHYAERILDNYFINWNKAYMHDLSFQLIGYVNDTDGDGIPKFGYKNK